jgi:uncharacterized repeat protein (TIGR03803 family)
MRCSISRLSCLCGAIAILGLLCTSGLAVTLPPGAGPVAPDVFAAYPSGTIVASLAPQSFALPDGDGGTFVTAVVRDPNNVFGAGDLDFLYQWTANTDNPDNFTETSASGFGTFATDVGFIDSTSVPASLTAYFQTPSGRNIAAPDSVQRSVSGKTIDWLFSDQGLNPGDVGYVLEVQTSAGPTGWSAGSAEIEAGAAANVNAFAPAAVPEPSALALLAIASAGLLAWQFRRAATGRFVAVAAVLSRAGRDAQSAGPCGAHPRMGLAAIMGAMLLLAVVFGQASAQTLTTLYSFDGANGSNPNAGLVLSGSTLYGTAASGGANGDGTVFSVPVGGGTATTLFAFDGIQGAYPNGGLVLSGSTLYGTTSEGSLPSGTIGDGTVFSIPVGGGTPTTLCSFDETDGTHPNGGLVLSGSTLYGTTFGDANGDGTIFDAYVGGGGPATLFAFDDTNGTIPQGGLTFNGGTLYGATPAIVFSIGGGALAAPLRGTGESSTLAVPRMGPRGPTLTTLFAFDGGAQGASPNGGLILNGSTLYGTASGGGADNEGTVFSLPLGGSTPTVLFSFDGAHGATPNGGLVLGGSTLYGTTEEGGANNDGTVFSIPVAGGTPTVLFSFDGASGQDPDGSLILSGSTLYGTTEGGGANGDGTVFALTVPEPSALALLGISAAGLLAWRFRRARLVASAPAALLFLTADHA